MPSASLKPGGRQAVQTSIEQSFLINGVRLFNCIPRKLREMKLELKDFKSKIDNYLIMIPDNPRMGKLIMPSTQDRISGRQSNSLMAWIKET